MTYLFGKQAPSSVIDVVTLLARVVLGWTFISHGWQKINEFGIAGTTAGFDQMGIPAPGAAARFAAFVELGGGTLLILGLLTPVAGVLLAGNMLGAFWFAHRGATVFVTEGGWELVAALGLGALLLAVIGSGRLSLDWLLVGRRSSEPRAAVSAAA